METKLLASLGKTAGLGGIALGVVLLIFKDFLKQKFLPDAGLEPAQAYHVLLAFLVFGFGIAAIGVVAWIIGQAAQPGAARSYPCPSDFSFHGNYGDDYSECGLGYLTHREKPAISSQNKNEQNITPKDTAQAIDTRPLETSGLTPETVPIRGVNRGNGDCVVEKHNSFHPGIQVNSLPLKAYQTMLDDASSDGNYSCVRTILSKGVNVNDLSSPMSPLMWAAKGGHENVVDLLLTSGASVNLRSKGGITALDYAADEHSLSTVKSLVEHGATMNNGLNGFTPLMRAAATGDLPIVNYMLSKGADVCKKSDDGRIAADVAHSANHTDIEASLRSVPCSQ